MPARSKMQAVCQGYFVFFRRHNARVPSAWSKHMRAAQQSGTGRSAYFLCGDEQKPISGLRASARSVARGAAVFDEVVESSGRVGLGPVLAITPKGAWRLSRPVSKGKADDNAERCEVA